MFPNDELLHIHVYVRTKEKKKRQVSRLTQKQRSEATQFSCQQNPKPTLTANVVIKSTGNQNSQ